MALPHFVFCTGGYIQVVNSSGALLADLEFKYCRKPDITDLRMSGFQRYPSSGRDSLPYCTTPTIRTELEMRRTEPRLHLSGTQILRYDGFFNVNTRLEGAKPSKWPAIII